MVTPRALRTAGTTLARPRPNRAAVETDQDTGTIGGPTTGGFIRTTVGATPGGSLLLASKITADVARSMRAHPQVSACLTVQSLPMLRADWTIECEDDDIREAVTAWWERVRAEVMRSATKTLWAGYSPNVLVWDIDPETGGLHVRKVRDLDPYTCKAHTQDNGDYDGFTQHEGAADEVILWGPDDAGRDRVLLTLWLVNGMESGNLYGRSILTPVLQDWQEAQMLRLFELRGLERFGNPVVVATAPAGEYVANADDINTAIANGETPPDPVMRRYTADAQATGESLANGSVVTLPSDRLTDAEGKDRGPSWGLQYLESVRPGADIAAAIAVREQRIRLGMIVPSLLLEGGDTVGSNALGQAHKGTFIDNAESRNDEFAGQITRHLIDRFVTLNWGPDAPKATLRAAPLADELADRLWDLATYLVQNGDLPVDREAVAARTGLPIGDLEEFDREREARRQEVAAQTQPAPPEPDGEGGASFRVDLARPADVTGVPDWRLPQQYDTPPGWRRALTTRENATSLRRIEDGMNTAEEATLTRLEELLDGSRERVLRQVAAILRRGGSDADILTALGTLDIGPAGPYAAAWTELQRTLWGIGLSSVAEELASFADKVPGNIGATGRALVAAYATASAERVTAELATRARVEVLNLYRSGVTSRAGLEAAVSDLFDRETRQESRSTRLTTRMLSAQAVNAGRRDAIERGGIPLRGAQYSAILDRRTCDLCERLDESVIPIGDLDYAKFTPPVHHNCRCVWVYVTAEEADFTPTWESPARSLVERHGSLVVH